MPEVSEVNSEFASVALRNQLHLSRKDVPSVQVLRPSPVQVPRIRYVKRHSALALLYPGYNGVPVDRSPIHFPW